MTVELHRPIPLSRIGAHPLDVRVQAEPDELAAVAARLRLPAVHSLRCGFTLNRSAKDVFDAHGSLTAEVEQTCVVSLDAFRSEVNESFHIRFVPEDALSDSLDPDAPDEVGYPGDVIDLGEAAVEQLALALDPYPHKPGTEPPAAASDAYANPFAGLERFKPGH